MDFAKQGGQHGIFRMEQGVITRVDDAAQALRSANENKPPMKSDEIV
jgi:hypothetical protein